MGLRLKYRANNDPYIEYCCDACGSDSDSDFSSFDLAVHQVHPKQQGKQLHIVLVEDSKLQRVELASIGGQPTVLCESCAEDSLTDYSVLVFDSNESAGAASLNVEATMDRWAEAPTPVELLNPDEPDPADVCTCLTVPGPVG